MRLATRIEQEASNEESYFRSFLLREDLMRLHSLENLFSTVSDCNGFVSEGLTIEWTPGNLRTWELLATLRPMLEAFYQCCERESDENIARLDMAWDAFSAARIDTLIGCLSRVPKPS